MTTARNAHPMKRSLLGTTLAFALSLGMLGLGVLGVVPAAASAAEGDQRPTYLGKTFYTGEFHAHTSVSDGQEMPTDAFDHVHDDTDADFFAVTEHDVMYDRRNGDDFITDWHDADSEEWRYVHEAADAFNASQDKLVAVPAIENTWYDGTGHINVFNTQWHATARATEKGTVDGFGNSFGTGDMKYDMYTFMARLKQDPDAIAQFNHPSTSSKGDFFGFRGLDPVTDERMELIEIKSAGQVNEYQKALDAGWHLGPVYNGDEHSPTWVDGAAPTSGVWASEHTLDGLYDAMHDRSTFSTMDANTVLAFSADDEMMGSILPAGTSSLDVDVELSDPDSTDSFTSVELVTNHGVVAHTFTGVSGDDLHLTTTQPAADGDYFYVRADQADGNFMVSAPIWVGEKTAGANYAPSITVPGGLSLHAAYGQTLDLPAATATDDSGTTPTMSYEVYDSRGQVPVDGGRFRVRGYDDTFVVVKATDDLGNTNAELVRIQVDKDAQDPAGVFQYLGSTATVSEQPGGAGLAVSTDRTIPTVYAQVAPADASWGSVPVRTSTNDTAYEINTIGNAETTYQWSITGQTLKSHEFDVADLANGQRYKYRFGVAVDGEAPDASDAGAWTGTEGEFVAGGGANEPVYVVGDLQATTHDAADLGLLRDVVDELETKTPGATTMIQTGDLVDNGGRGQYWDEVFDHVFDGLDLQVAPVAGNHETYGDLDYNSLSEERTAILSNLYDLPKNGVIGESNYSFNRGDIHFSVLNSNVDMDQQLRWLRDDVRASTKTWNVVVGHFSYYGGQHGDDTGLAGDRPKVTKALDELGVDLYIGGHDHVYKRSTIYDGRLAQTPEEEARGTTYVTMGSAGPKFYENTAHWWDDVVDDEDIQMGGVLEVVDGGLKLSTYTIDGRVVDSYTVRKPTGPFRIGSTDISDHQMPGVGFLSYDGSRAELTVSAVAYDNELKTQRAIRTADVTLDHQGSEQFVEFDSPLPVHPGDTVKLFVWDSLADQVPLLPARTLRVGIAGSGTAEDPYLITSADDLTKIVNDPSGYYRLTKDLDLTDVGISQVDRGITFTGTFDGAGHTISGYEAPGDQGVGLFTTNYGTIKDLHVDADVTKAKENVGLVADANYGIIERILVSGSITATGSVGAVSGNSFGTVEDTYSTADVHATGLYAGGVVGLAQSGSLTTHTYSTGSVVADGRNAGGIVSYGYEETEVTHNVALNSAVTAPSFAHAIVGRVLAGQTATLEANYVSGETAVVGQSLADAPAADNWKGEVVPKGRIRTQDFFSELGWDFGTVWSWNDTGLRPVLQSVHEDVAALPTPTLPTNGQGQYVIDSVADLEQVGDFPDEDYVLDADLDLSGSPYTSLGAVKPFIGDFDGAGHTISGLTSTTGGLFATVAAGGAVHDLAVVDADITKSANNAGIIANSLNGTVERVYTSGRVNAAGYAGGITGTSLGTIRDAYSTADVTTTGSYAGGLVGVDDTPSLLERSYARGTITSGSRAGGLTGYCRDSGCVVRDSFALNPGVTGSSYAQRVVSRFADGATGTLENNYALGDMTAATQTVTAIGPSTLNGASKSLAESRTQDTWKTGLGFDFDDVWAWDADGRRPVLRSVTEDVPALPSAPSLPSADGYYLVDSPADLGEVAAWPAEKFRLTADLDLAGVTAPRLGSPSPFTGELDGQGHLVSGLTSTSGGLFDVIGAGGSVHDLGVVDATVTKSTNLAGILVDRLGTSGTALGGTVERVFTSGTVSSPSYAGGIAGTSFGTIRDAYSTATVSTTSAAYAGGIVGVDDSPSTLQRSYATGSVASAAASAGGIAGYARNAATTIGESFALNPSVTGTATTQRIAARYASTAVPATMVSNFAVETMSVGTQANTATGATTLNGETKTAAEAKSRATWETGLGWDFDSTWAWDDTRKRPVLQSTAEPSPVGRNAPAVYVDSSTSVRLVADAAGVQIGHEAVTGADGEVTLTLHGGADAAGRELSVLTLAPDADLDAPSEADVVYLNQVTLDETGTAELRLVLPSGDLKDYVLGANAEGASGRYLKVLDGSELPTDPGNPGEPGEQPATTSLGASAVSVDYGRTAQLSVTVTGGDTKPTGTVTATYGGKVLALGQVANGVARLTLPARSLTPGARTVALAYGGDGGHAGTSGQVRVTVRKAASKTRVKATTKITTEKRAKAVIAVTGANGVQATGRVKVRIGGTTRTVTLAHGRATVRLPLLRKPGRKALVATYLGNDLLAASTARTTVKVRKR